MKKFIIAFALLLVTAVQASAMSYQQARDQALFLTDKMAYELNLTDEQYEAAYEINLDYLMGVNTYDDLYGAYWRQRNLDLSYILYSWQYDAYCAASYFYRPLYWDGGFWHFAIYARYPHRDYFFFGRPEFYISYHGGHSWYRNGGRSWYYDHRPALPRNEGRHYGMRDGFERGNYGNGVRFNNNNRSFGNARANSNRSFGNARANSNRSFGNARANVNNRSFGNARVNGNRSFNNSNNNRSFGGARVNSNRSFGNVRNSMPGTPQNNRQRSFGSERKSSTRTTVGRPSNMQRSFGNSRSSMPSRTFSPSNSSRRSSSAPRSFGSSSSSRRSFNSAPSRNFGGSAPSTRSSSRSSSSSKSSGGHFGSRR
ncbi:MAG: hypothetical protein ACOYJF_03500 [Prevotella sp.]|jgi:hypothetical protein